MMRAKVVYGDDVIFNAMENGRTTAAFNNYCQSQWEQAKLMTSHVSSTIMQSVNNLVDRIATTDVYGLAEAAMNYVGTLWGKDTFQALATLSKIQNAPDCMVPYLMAQTDVRKLHVSGSCESYGDRYIDANPGMMGINHEEWKMVMNGVMSIDEDTGQWESTTYFQTDDRYDDVEPLSHYQSTIVRDAWLEMAEAVKAGRDPTSCWNADL